MPTTEYRFQRPLLYPKQLAAIYTPARYALIEASTKSGKTVGCLAWIAEQAFHGWPGWNGWWVAPSYGQAEIAFRRIKRFLPQDAYTANGTKLTVTLTHNGATIWFKTAEKPDNLYGEDVFAAVVDEATRCREEAWHAIRSTLTATEGPCRIIGNVKGRKNWVYHMCRKAEAGEPGMAYAKITAADAVEAGVLNADEIEDARRQLPEQVFNELYMAIPTDDGANPFGLKHIGQCAMDAVEWTLAQRIEPHGWGWDLAKRVDWTVGIGLGTNGRVCRFERFQQSWEHTVSNIVAACRDTPLTVDATGVGDPVVERLQTRGMNVTGFTFTANSKQALMERLALAIQHGEVRYPDGPIRSELESFEYEYTRTGVRYTAPEGMHDDCVIALGLAVWQYQTAAAGPSIGSALQTL